MTPLRIVLLGAANSIHLQRWANALAARGHRILLLSQHPCDAALLDPVVERQWLPHRRGLGYVTNAAAVRRFVRQWRGDLLHVHYASGYGTLGALAGVHPALLSVWGSDVYTFPETSPLHRALLRRVLRSTDGLASTSEAMAARVRELVPGIAPLAITPFGVDMDRFVPVDRHDGPLTLGTVKTLAAPYGIDLLLRAFAMLKADPAVASAHPDLRLLLVGGGPDAAALQVLTRRLGVDGATRFAGAVPHAEVPAWIARLDVYVAASRHESFGVAVVEASACGRPVVTSDAGGLREVVRDGETGFVVPSGDVPALAAALRTLVLDAGLRQRFGAAGRAFVRQAFAWPVCVDRMEAAYAALLKDNAPDRP